jgi:hypothetical protein
MPVAASTSTYVVVRTIRPPPIAVDTIRSQVGAHELLVVDVAAS